MGRVEESRRVRQDCQPFAKAFGMAEPHLPFLLRRRDGNPARIGISRLDGLSEKATRTPLHHVFLYDWLMAIYDIGDARRELSRLIEEALAGQEVVIARNGVALIRLAPVRRIPGRNKGEIRISPDFEFTDAEIDEFEASIFPEE